MAVTWAPVFSMLWLAGRQVRQKLEVMRHSCATLQTRMDFSTLEAQQVPMSSSAPCSPHGLSHCMHGPVRGHLALVAAYLLSPLQTLHASKCCADTAQNKADVPGHDLQLSYSHAAACFMFGTDMNSELVLFLALQLLQCMPCCATALGLQSFNGLHVKLYTPSSRSK